MFTRTAALSMARTARSKTEDYQGQKVFKGGENGIVVFSIDQSTGEPKRI